jgi:hypothetical protein
MCWGCWGELPGERVIGFVSHVQTELRRAAAEAGCGRVLAQRCQ